MRPSQLLPTFLIVGLVAACASGSSVFRHQPGCIVSNLAVDFSGADATDCGVLNSYSFRRERNKTLACARQAISSGKAFRFGYGAIGDDAGYCKLSLRKSDGSLWSVNFDYDLSYGAEDSRRGPILYVARCTGVSLDPQDGVKGHFFGMSGCVPDQEAWQSVAQSIGPF